MAERFTQVIPLKPKGPAFNKLPTVHSYALKSVCAQTFSSPEGDSRALSNLIRSMADFIDEKGIEDSNFIAAVVAQHSTTTRNSDGDEEKTEIYFEASLHYHGGRDWDE